MSSNGIREYLRSLAQPFTYLGLAMLAFIYIAVAYLIIHDRDEAYASAARRQCRPNHRTIVFSFVRERRCQDFVSP
jgi:hypothetical protein